MIGPSHDCAVGELALLASPSRACDRRALNGLRPQAVWARRSTVPSLFHAQPRPALRGARQRTGVDRSTPVGLAHERTGRRVDERTVGQRRHRRREALQSGRGPWVVAVQDEAALHREDGGRPHRAEVAPTRQRGEGVAPLLPVDEVKLRITGTFPRPRWVEKASQERSPTGAGTDREVLRVPRSSTAAPTRSDRGRRARRLGLLRRVARPVRAGRRLVDGLGWRGRRSARRAAMRARPCSAAEAAAAASARCRAVASATAAAVSPVASAVVVADDTVDGPAPLVPADRLLAVGARPAGAAASIAGAGAGAGDEVGVAACPERDTSMAARTPASATPVATIAARIVSVDDQSIVAVYPGAAADQSPSVVRMSGAGTKDDPWKLKTAHAMLKEHGDWMPLARPRRARAQPAEQPDQGPLTLRS